MFNKSPACSFIYRRYQGGGVTDDVKRGAGGGDFFGKVVFLPPPPVLILPTYILSVIIIRLQKLELDQITHFDTF